MRRQFIREMNDHTRDILLARRREQAVGFRFINRLGTLVIALLHMGIGFEETRLMVPAGFRMRLGQGRATGNRCVKLFAVILCQSFEIERLVGLHALGRNRLVQRRHRRGIIPRPQRRLPGLQIGVHLRVRRWRNVREKQKGEKE